MFPVSEYVRNCQQSDKDSNGRVYTVSQYIAVQEGIAGEEGGHMKQWLARVIEKVLGRFYEGPSIPERFENGVVEFANRHPHATRKDWSLFALEHASNAYEAGYVRGVERSERDYQHPVTAPEVIADALDPHWRDKAYDWRTGQVFGVGDVTEPLEAPTDEGIVDYDPIEAMRQHRRAMAGGASRRPGGT